MGVKSFKKSKIHIEAYHGTIKLHVKLIETEGFKTSNKIQSWLGDGVYFFREDQAQAEIFAKRTSTTRLKELKEHVQTEELDKSEYGPCIIQWCDQLEKEEFLNLDSREDAIFFHYHITTFKKMLQEKGYEVETALWEWNNKLFNSLPSAYTVIQRTFPVPSHKYGKHAEALFNTVMFFPILKGNKDVSAEVEYTTTQLIQGTMISVRNAERLSLEKICWKDC
ncbi:hypothetical protein [Exiguobacterium sp. s151]|uniref:hypothetical protein n=1 Tax=Exiguobacterium sp. s151 TaxID=2751229 RepID=UPI001BE8DA06|nr:hypothetical protein [Exiguobacterium sp. s151]